MPRRKPKAQPSQPSSSSSPDTSSGLTGANDVLGQLLLRIDGRLDKIEERLRRVESRPRTASRVAKPKAEKPPEDLYVTDVFSPIMDVLETWNDDRRTLLRARGAADVL